jgi:hypothetical protein
MLDVDQQAGRELYDPIEGSRSAHGERIYRSFRSTPGHTKEDAHFFYRMLSQVAGTLRVVSGGTVFDYARCQWEELTTITSEVNRHLTAIIGRKSRMTGEATRRRLEVQERHLPQCIAEGMKSGLKEDQDRHRARSRDRWPRRELPHKRARGRKCHRCEMEVPEGMSFDRHKEICPKK